MTAALEAIAAIPPLTLGQAAVAILPLLVSQAITLTLAARILRRR